MLNHKNIINVATITIDKPLDKNIFLTLSKYLPISYTKDILSYQSDIDKSLSLLGYILLLFLLNKDKHHTLDSLYRDKYGRSFLKTYTGDFNISKSHRCVICAISNQKKIGIDIEYIQNINIKIYKDQFSNTEWNTIINNINPIEVFYDFWTKKEAISKLDGRGLSLKFSQIPIMDDIISWNNMKLKTTPLILHDKYNCTIASHIDSTVNNIYTPSVIELTKL